MTPELAEQIDWWAAYVKSSNGAWKKEHTAFINAQFEKAEACYRRLAQTPGGKQKIIRYSESRTWTPCHFSNRTAVPRMKSLKQNKACVELRKNQPNVIYGFGRRNQCDRHWSGCERKNRFTTHVPGGCQIRRRPHRESHPHTRMNPAKPPGLEEKGVRLLRLQGQQALVPQKPTRPHFVGPGLSSGRHARRSTVPGEPDDRRQARKQRVRVSLENPDISTEIRLHESKKEKMLTRYQAGLGATSKRR